MFKRVEINKGKREHCKVDRKRCSYSWKTYENGILIKFQTKSLLNSSNISAGKITIETYYCFFYYYKLVFVNITRTYCICIATKEMSNFALHSTSYLSIALSKILPHSKTIKNAKKLSVFGKNDSRCLSNFLQTHIFWNWIIFLELTIKLFTGIFDFQKW